VPSRSPNKASDSVNHGTLPSGSYSNARIEPPRCALIAKRNDAEVAATQALIFAAVGRW
jgi:hypothetical protein